MNNLFSFCQIVTHKRKVLLARTIMDNNKLFSYLPEGFWPIPSYLTEIFFSSFIAGLFTWMCFGISVSVRFLNFLNTDAPKKAALIKITLLKRNAQLAKMIQHLVGVVFYTEADDIDILSTCIEWVFQYLRAHYNIESKDTNFLKITDHICKSDMQPQVIYKTFRTSF